MNLTSVRSQRIGSIDVLRGIVMVIMALDHVRDFFHAEAFTRDPLDPATTYPALFFTRWITHFCAPIFVFLAGTAAYMMSTRMSKPALSAFLIKRGIWLVFIEVAIITFGWTFNPFYNLFIIQVIWAIGLSMIMLGLLVNLSWKVILAIGLIIVFGHNILDTAEAVPNQQIGFWWNLMHHAHFSVYQIWPRHVAIIVYAFVPWAGIMFCGYAFGRLFRREVDAMKRRKVLLQLGFGLLTLFVLLRWSNLYGDPVHWSHQKTTMRTVLSFLNVNKYPPSLLFVCLTIGVAMFLLVILEPVQNWFTRVMSVYGRVPFFYYVVHIYLIHLLTVIAFFASGYGRDQIIDPNSFFFFRPLKFGYSLWGVYAVWIFVVLVLYPVCRWYNRYKQTHSYWWLSYL
jgi:uncharacterized membrane protein